MTPMRKFFIFASGFIVAFSLLFFSGAFLRLSNSPKRLPYEDSFLPSGPHSHGEFDEYMNRRGRMKPHPFKDSQEHSHVGEDIIAKDLYNKVRIFCWIMTNPNSHKTKAVHVKATWAKRCNKYIFISSKADPDLPAVDIRVQEGRDHLWGKTKGAFAYIYRHEVDNFDFFFKADDDTFMVPENMRYMLRDVDPNKPWLFGRKFKPFVKQGYMSGGAGYVISRAGLRLLMKKGWENIPGCRRDEGGAEDVHFGQCAEAVGVKAGDSRDSLGRERFHPFPPDSHLRPIDKGLWIWQYNYYPLKTGPECCSDTSVSFHYVSPEWMYILEFYVYHWQPYGIVRDVQTVRRYLAQENHKENWAVANGHKDLHEAIQKERAAAKEELLKAEKLRSEAAQAKSDAETQLREARSQVKTMKEEAAKTVKTMKEQAAKEVEAMKREAAGKKKKEEEKAKEVEAMKREAAGKKKEEEKAKTVPGAMKKTT